MTIRSALIIALLVALVSPAAAGPPFATDDPQPTEYGQFEVYAYAMGTTTRDGTGGAAGIDFNYGAAPDLQLTAVVPIGYDRPSTGGSTTSLGNVELAAKYRFLHQDDFGWDVSIFPRLFLPSGSDAVGERHVSLLIPIWVQKDWGPWSTFGGGGCTLNNGGGSQDFCTVGWALTRQVLPSLQLGVEVFHQTADTRGGSATTGASIGLRYDLNDHYHLMADIGPGIESAAETNLYSWYTALLFTF